MSPHMQTRPCGFTGALYVCEPQAQCVPLLVQWCAYRPFMSPHILLAATGSVASIKLAELCKQLQVLGEVKVVVTPAAYRFVKALDMPPETEVLQDEDEWLSWHAVGDAVVHIELRRWADVLVIAPLSANSMAKLAVGMCDNLLTCVVRAWDWQHRPLIVAPAMNTLMWESSFTAEHVQKLMQLGAVVVPPVAKTLACGDVGLGAMASPQAIVEVVKAVLGEGSEHAGVHGAAKHAQLGWLRCLGLPRMAVPQLSHGAKRLTPRSDIGSGLLQCSLLPTSIVVSILLGFVVGYASQGNNKHARQPLRSL